FPRPPGSPLFPYTTLFRSEYHAAAGRLVQAGDGVEERGLARAVRPDQTHDGAAGHVEINGVHRDQAAEAHGDGLRGEQVSAAGGDRKSTRLNSSHDQISYA